MTKWQEGMGTEKKEGAESVCSSKPCLDALHALHKRRCQTTLGVRHAHQVTSREGEQHIQSGQQQARQTRKPVRTLGADAGEDNGAIKVSSIQARKTIRTRTPSSMGDSAGEGSETRCCQMLPVLLPDGANILKDRQLSLRVGFFRVRSMQMI